jgi:hypothetical protein
MFDFETLIEEEGEAFRQSIKEPDNPGDSPDVG